MAKIKKSETLGDKDSLAGMGAFTRNREGEGPSISSESELADEFDVDSTGIGWQETSIASDEDPLPDAHKSTDDLRVPGERANSIKVANLQNQMKILYNTVQSQKQTLEKQRKILKLIKNFEKKQNKTKIRIEKIKIESREESNMYLEQKNNSNEKDDMNTEPSKKTEGEESNEYKSSSSEEYASSDYSEDLVKNNNEQKSQENENGKGTFKDEESEVQRRLELCKCLDGFEFYDDTEDALLDDIRKMINFDLNVFLEEFQQVLNFLKR